MKAIRLKKKWANKEKGAILSVDPSTRANLIDRGIAEFVEIGLDTADDDKNSKPKAKKTAKSKAKSDKKEDAKSEEKEDAKSDKKEADKNKSAK